MIAKEKQFTSKRHPTSLAGDKQEQDVAFYLRRAFKDHPEIFIFNDLNVYFNGEHAQIDHLILYKFGFVLIESKSITGEVKVNQHEEWTRSYRGRWQGMPSPIKQMELQQKLLKELLHQNRASILDKLFGVKQQSFRYRQYNAICAVSSNAVIDRDSMPRKVSEHLVKSEFLTDKLHDVMNLKSSVVQTVTFDTRPDFKRKELQSIALFLVEHDKAGRPTTNDINQGHSDAVVNALNDTKDEQSDISISLSCRKCGNTNNLAPMNGRYGYYLKCPSCQGNTPMKQACQNCGFNKTKVQKRGEDYSLLCEPCGLKTPVNF